MSEEKDSEEIIAKTQKVTKEKNKYQTVFESLSSPAIVITPDRQIDILNNSAMDYFYKDRVPDELYNNQEHLQHQMAWLDNIVLDLLSSSNLELKKEMEVETAKGKRYFEINLKKMLEKGDQLFGITILLNDLTERIKYDNLRKQFIDTMTHELRTPITSIDLSVKNLIKFKNQLSSAQSLKILDILNLNVEILNNTVAELLDLSRIDSARITFSKTFFSVNEILYNVITQLEPKATAKNIRILLELGTYTEIMVFGDKSRLEQVIRIFLDNAIKYSNLDSEVEIALSPHFVDPIDPKNQGFLIQIIDNGIGIRKEDLKHLFHRFFRAADVDSITGSGLGLAIAEEIISLHGGKIYVESEYGKGSKFGLLIPKAS